MSSGASVRLVTVDDIRDAANRIRGSVVRTPLVPAPWADPQRPAWIKRAAASASIFRWPSLRPACSFGFATIVSTFGK